MRMLPCTHGSFRIIPRYCSSFVNLAGMPIDRKFAGRYYELSQIFDRVDYFSGVLLGLILGLAFLIAACGIEAGSERLRRILDSLLALSALSVLVVIVWHVLFPPSGGADVEGDVAHSRAIPSPHAVDGFGDIGTAAQVRCHDRDRRRVFQLKHRFGLCPWGFPRAPVCGLPVERGRCL